VHLRPFAVAIIVLSILLSSLLSSLSSPLILHAQSEENEPRFSISPVATKTPASVKNGYFVYKLRSGATATGSVLLRNTGKKPVVIELAVLDARTSQTGGSAFAETGSKPAAVGTWITLAQPKVTLQPGAKKQIGFSIQVPESVERGQHLAGITAYVVKNPAKDGKQTGASIVVQTRYVIAVQVDVPGTWTPSMKIPAVSLLEQPSGTVIGVSIRNDGDTFVKPSGSMTLSDSTGKRVLDHPIKMDTFVTNTEVTYPVPCTTDSSPANTTSARG